MVHVIEHFCKVMVTDLQLHVTKTMKLRKNAV